MKDYLIYLEKRGFSPSSQKRQHAHIKAFLHWLKSKKYEANQLQYPQMIHYIEAQRQRGIGENTLVHYLRYIHIYFDYLIEQGQANHHPLQHLRLRGQVRQKKQDTFLQDLLKEEELGQIYRCYQSNKRLNKKHLNLLTCIIYQGMATAEMRYVKVKHLDLEQARLFIPSSKKYRQRYVDLKASQILALSRYIDNKQPEAILFDYKNDKQATNSRTWLCQQIKIELKRSQQSHIAFKNLNQIRNSRIALWVKQHGLRKAQYLAGHTNIVSTQRYKTSDIDALQRQINQFHPLK